MNELPKELTPELLGLVLDDNSIENMEICESSNELHYDTYKPTNDLDKRLNIGNIYNKRINLDTLTRLCKEWCLVQDFVLVPRSRHKLKGYDCDIYTKDDHSIDGFESDTELEAVIKATEWAKDMIDDCED
jgi:hypothetical protein